MEDNKTVECKPYHPVVRQLVELLKVKSLLSLMVAIVFCFLAFTKQLESKDIMYITIMVFQAFFQHQASKGSSNSNIQ